MEREVITTQTINSDTAAKVGFSLLFSIKVIFTLSFIYICILLFTGMMMFLSQGETDMLTNEELIETLRPLYIILILLPLIITGFWFSIKNIYSKPKYGRYFKNVTYIITSESFSRSGQDFSDKHKWEDLYKIKETSKFYLIQTAKNQANIIDKSQLDSVKKEDLRIIFNAIKSKIKVSLKKNSL